MNYTIKYLDSATYDRLPYQKVKDSLGCADQKTKTAYVRRTGLKPLDMFVADHEIDELVNKYSEHEIDGIRYKSSNKLIGTLAPLAIGLLTGGTGFALAPWFGSTATGALLGSGAGAISGYQEGGGKGALSGGLSGGMGGGAGAAFGGGFMAPGATATTGAGGVGHAVKPTLWQRMAGGVGGLMGTGPVGDVTGAATAAGGPTSNLMWGTQGQVGTGGGTPVTGGAGQLPTANLAGGGGSVMNPFGTGQGIAAGPGMGNVAAGGPSGLSGILGKIGGTPTAGGDLGKTLLGAGISGIGQLTKPDIPFPDLMGAGGVQGFQKLLQTGPSGVEVSNSLRTQLEDEVSGKYDQLKQQAKDRFKALRPGADFESDSDYQKTIMDLDADEQDELSNAVSNYQENQYQTQLQGMQYLSQMNIYQLMGETGLDVANAQEFQNWLQQIGGGIFQSGLGMM